MTTISSKGKLLLIIVTVLMIASGCSAGNGEEAKNDGDQIELRFTWWGTQERHDRTLEVIDLFEEKYPDIKITPEFTGWDGYWEKLATQAAGQNLPDLIQMSYAYLSEYVERDLVVSLDPYIESGVLNFDNVDDVYLETGLSDGQLYSVNLGANSFAVVYDPAMFEEAGVEVPEPGYTYEDLEQMATTLQSSLGDGVYGVKTSNNYDGFLTYVRQQGQELYNDDGNGLGYDDDQIFVDYFEYWNRLIQEGIANPPEVEKQVVGLEDELIVHNKAPIQTLPSNTSIALTYAADRPLKLTVYPSLEGGVKGHMIMPSQLISATTHSDHPEAAAKFINFMTNDLEANDVLKAERGVPISSEVRDSLYEQVDEATQETFDYLELVAEYTRPRTNTLEPAGASEVRALFERVREQINYGESTPAEAAEQFRREATEILKR